MDDYLTMTKSKKKNKKKKFNLIDWLDKYVFRTVNFVAVVLAIVVFMLGRDIVITEILKKEGISTYAEVVRKRTSIGGRGGDHVRVYYRFYAPEYDQYYTGKTSYRNLFVGENIEILYNPKHPEQNRYKYDCVKQNQ